MKSWAIRSRGLNEAKTLSAHGLFAFQKGRGSVSAKMSVARASVPPENANVSKSAKAQLFRTIRQADKMLLKLIFCCRFRKYEYHPAQILPWHGICPQQRVDERFTNDVSVVWSIKVNGLYLLYNRCLFFAGTI
jgi:hypothetical protein